MNQQSFVEGKTEEKYTNNSIVSKYFVCNYYHNFQNMMEAVKKRPTGGSVREIGCG